MLPWPIVLDISKTLVGLLYIYLEYNARKSLWIINIIMPAISLALFYQKGIYADFAINVYYLAMAGYGYWHWSRMEKTNAMSEKTKPNEISRETDMKNGNQNPGEAPYKNKDGQGIRFLTIKNALILSAVWLLCWVAIAGLLSLTDSNVVWLDSFTTSLSIIGTWMLAKKYAEQWWIWIAVDLVSTYLYWIKGIPFSAGLYLLYTIIALFGYFKWKRLANQ